MENKSKTINRATGFWAVLAGFFLGVIVGFFFAPVKNGVEFGNNSGNTYNYNGIDNDFEDEDFDKDDDSLEF